MNGAEHTVLYDAVSADLALEEGMISGVRDGGLCVFCSDYRAPMQDIDRGVTSCY